MTDSSLIKPDRARRLGGAGQLLHSGFLTPECFTLHLRYCQGYTASASTAALVLLPPLVLPSLGKFLLSLSLKKSAQESPQAPELYTVRCLKCVFKTMTSLWPSAKQWLCSGNCVRCWDPGSVSTLMSSDHPPLAQELTSSLTLLLWIAPSSSSSSGYLS